MYTFTRIAEIKIILNYWSRSFEAIYTVNAGVTRATAFYNRIRHCSLWAQCGLLGASDVERRYLEDNRGNFV